MNFKIKKRVLKSLKVKKKNKENIYINLPLKIIFIL